MDQRQELQNFFADIVEKTRAQPGGEDLLSLLDTYGFDVQVILAEQLDEADADTRAFLFMNDDSRIIFLTPNCNVDDFVHELSHIHHVCAMDDALSNPADLKHRYITKAMREADAFARQMESFLQTLSDPKVLARERITFAEAQRLQAHPDENTFFKSDACRLFLYVGAQTSPDQMLEYLKNGACTADKLMLDIFCAVLYEHIQNAYEELHLDQINEELNELLENGKGNITVRQEPMATHTEDDILFFADCIRAYGSWGRDQSYLVDEAGYGPSVDVFLERLFHPYVCEILDDMNTHLKNNPAPVATPPHRPEPTSP